MSISLAIARQFRQPEGWLGKFIGRLMEVGNRPAYKWTLLLLDIKPRDDVFEIGYGPGVGLKMVAQHATEGKIGGIDFSKAMFDRACRRNAASIRTGRMSLVLGDFSSAEFEPASYDWVFAINVLYFWTEPVEVFCRIRRMLKDGGRLAITFSEPESLHRMPCTKTPVFNAYTEEAVLDMMRKAGFSKVSAARKRLGTIWGVCIVAERPAANAR